MDNYLGLKLKLTLKDGSTTEGTVNSINDSTQKLSLIDVRLWPKGIKTSGEGIEFPELTIVASNIVDIEIITTNVHVPSSSSKTKKNPKPQNSSFNSKTVKSYHSDSSNRSGVSVSSPSIHSTPSVLVPPKQTFPSGNARKNLPTEDFDFVGNLARFDKAKEFKIIQAEDLVPMEDRLVSINSPQRKLGINENVLDEKDTGRVIRKTAGGMVNRSSNLENDPNIEVEADVIMDKFKHLTLSTLQQQVHVRSPIFIENGSSSDDDDRESSDTDTDVDNESEIVEAAAYDLPIINSALYNEYLSSLSEGEIERIRLISSLNFSHHLLTHLNNPSMKSLVLLLGVGEESILGMETVSLLLNHNRFWNADKKTVYAIFTAGGPGSGGKRIELTSSALKMAKKRLSSFAEVEFVTSLAEIVKLQDVIVIDALGNEAELTSNALIGLTNWLNNLMLTAAAADSENERIIYGIEGSLFKHDHSHLNLNTRSHIQLISFGLPRDSIIPSLPCSNSLLLIDSGIPGNCEINQKIDTFQIFSNSFISELDY